MILEHYKSDQSEYWVLLIADYHLEFPIPQPRVKGTWQPRVELIWRPFSIADTAARLADSAEYPDDTLHNKVDALGRELFGPLEQKYGGYWDPAMNLWTITGDLRALSLVFYKFSSTLLGGTGGADDNTYDYWPNAFDMLCEMARDLTTINPKPKYARRVATVVRDVIAYTGPPEEWEAGDIIKAEGEILSLIKEA